MIIWKTEVTYYDLNNEEVKMSFLFKTETIQEAQSATDQCHKFFTKAARGVETMQNFYISKVECLGAVMSVEAVSG